MRQLAIPFLAAIAALSASLSAAQSHFTLDGDTFDNNLGASLAQVADLNGDGYSDLVAGEPGHDGAIQDGGRILLISGKDGAVIRTHYGSGANQRLGKYVAAAGDHNGDGTPDYVGGSEYDNEFGYPTGYVRVWSGSDGSLIREYSSSLNWDFFGSAICGVGDLNNDGFDDLAVGAHDDDWGSLGAGAAYVYSGMDGSTIHTLRGGHPWDRFGSAITSCGDMNQDGVPDFAVSSPRQKAGAKNAGKVVVFSGSTGQALFNMRGRGRNSFFGTRMVCLGDISGDGIPDLAISALNDSTNILGLEAYLEIRSGSDGAVISTLEQETDGQRFGYSMAAVDLNGDGFKDLAVGSPMAGAIGSTGLASGRVQIFSGPSGRLLETILGSQPFARMGSSVAGLDDLNGDGIAELAIGSPGDGGGSIGGGFVESTAPSVYPHLLQPTLSAGSRAAIELENGAPLSNYTVHASLSGPGNQNAPGGPMLDLAPNLILVGSMNTNIFGSARLTVPVPPGSEGVQVWIQAWNPSEAATMTSAVVQ